MDAVARAQLRDILQRALDRYAVDGLVQLCGVIIHRHHGVTVFLVGFAHVDGPCTGFARAHDHYRAVGVFGGHLAQPLTQRVVQKQPPSQTAAADKQKDEHRGHAVCGIEQHTVDKAAVHHIHHGGGHGDHTGKADQIPLAGVFPQHRVQPARQKADDIHRHDPRQIFVQQCAVVGPPHGLYRTVCPQQQSKIKAECHNGCIQQHQQRTAQQHLRGILGFIFHLRSSFFLSAPRVALRCFFGSVLPRQCRKDTTTRLYYTHNPRLCPENLRFYHFPLFFPVFACRSTARTSSQSPSGSAASKNTMAVTVPPAVSTASCPGNP